MTRARCLCLFLLICAVAACSSNERRQRVARSVEVKPTLRPDLVAFADTAELKAWVADKVKEQLARGPTITDSASAAAEPAPPSSPVPDTASASESKQDSESITNTQEAGVDEGGIVKTHGDHLVILRRGRLFSVELGDHQMRPVSMVDVFPPGSTKQTWYDEMLISGDRIVVVGYSYDAGATELGLFEIDGDGRIEYRSTYLLRSNDYYSSRNYASRLLGDKLVFYMPYSLVEARLTNGKVDTKLALPGVRGYSDKPDDWDQIITASHIYRPIQPTDWPILHTVVTCDLAKREMACEAQGIVGPYGRTFYVSSKAVYVWVTPGYDQPRKGATEKPQGVVYRLPLDGGQIGAMRVAGAPVDQFSFKESADGFLNVLVRSEGGGDWMWSPEVTAGDVALLRVPVDGFGARVGTARREAYAELPKPKADWAFQNRFVGDHVLYSTGSGWGYPADQRENRLFIYPFAGGQPVALELPHGVDRIEAMGDDAVVVGTDGKSLHFSAVDLGSQPRLAGRFAQTGLSQGELRSHGFFFKPTGEGQGVLGLPVRGGSEPGYAHLVEGSVEVIYLQVEDLEFRRLGVLEASGAAATSNDGCVVSCVDWYGNARPIFYRGRVFALLGYELVEGRIGDGTIREIGRASFMPRSDRAR